MAPISLRSWVGHPGTKLLLIIILFLVGELLVMNRNPTRTPTPNINADDSLQVGQAVDNLQAVDMNAEGQTFDFLGADTFLFVFSATCPACERNLGNWKDIEEKVGSANVLYVSTDPISDSVKKYVADKGIAPRTLFFANAQESSRFKIHQIPQTIYVSKGQVKAIQVGVLSTEKVEMFKTIQKEV